jgi:hypothetical protein
MAPPQTLTEYYQEASNDAATAVNAAQTALTTAIAGVTAAQAALAAAVGALATDQATTSSLQSQLSQATLPSDATALVALLQANLVKTRIDQAAVGAASDAADAAARAQQHATAALAAG